MAVIPEPVVAVELEVTNVVPPPRPSKDSSLSRVNARYKNVSAPGCPTADQASRILAFGGLTPSGLGPQVPIARRVLLAGVAALERRVQVVRIGAVLNPAGGLQGLPVEVAVSIILVAVGALHRATGERIIRRRKLSRYRHHAESRHSKTARRSSHQQPTHAPHKGIHSVAIPASYPASATETSQACGLAIAGLLRPVRAGRPIGRTLAYPVKRGWTRLSTLTRALAVLARTCAPCAGRPVVFLPVPRAGSAVRLSGSCPSRAASRRRDVGDVRQRTRRCVRVDAQREVEVNPRWPARRRGITEAAPAADAAQLLRSALTNLVPRGMRSQTWTLRSLPGSRGCGR